MRANHLIVDHVYWLRFVGVEIAYTFYIMLLYYWCFTWKLLHHAFMYLAIWSLMRQDVVLVN